MTTQSKEAFTWWQDFTEDEQRELIDKYFMGLSLEFVTKSSTRILEMFQKERLLGSLLDNY